jgi:hypothetical protein
MPLLPARTKSSCLIDDRLMIHRTLLQGTRVSRSMCKDGHSHSRVSNCSRVNKKASSWRRAVGVQLLLLNLRMPNGTFTPPINNCVALGRVQKGVLVPPVSCFHYRLRTRRYCNATLSHVHGLLKLLEQWRVPRVTLFPHLVQTNRAHEKFCFPLCLGFKGKNIGVVQSTKTFF